MSAPCGIELTRHTDGEAANAYNFFEAVKVFVWLYD